MDEMIDQELEALRNPVASRRGMGEAILAMQAPAGRRRWAVRWPLWIGSAVAGGGAVVLIASLSTGNAHASELRAIGAAQEQQQTRHQKSVVFDHAYKPTVIMEFWRDGLKEAYRQFTPDGKLGIVRVFDGKHKYHYASYNPANGKEYASVEIDTKPDFGNVTLRTILASRMAREHKTVKKTGVKLNGRPCDFYLIGKGYYRYWVDPNTKLPLQREIYGAGGLIWKRDVYDYPESLSPETFKPYKLGKIKYIEIVRGPRGAAQKAQTQKR